MKIVSIEEHFLTPEITAAWDASTIGSEGTEVFEQGEIGERIKDLGEGRLALMDESGIDVQVLSVTTPALHGGGDGYYTPIAVGPHLSTELRPLYFGMQFADQFAGAELLECSLATSQNVTSYYARRDHETLLSLINKGAASITIKLLGPLAHRAKKELRLTGPSLAAHTGIRLEAVPPSGRGRVIVPPYSAVLLSWS
jgi:hypothetical protein